LINFSESLSRHHAGAAVLGEPNISEAKLDPDQCAAGVRRQPCRGGLGDFVVMNE
jgi:hypothetical protein